ncbi:MFS transporter [Cereibacter azotoformans]|uniref:Putative MFS family arabinose efflux permease n=1 Tax=Cereibacter azotoformans TaxID=43057 RepID=A0A2T5JTS8_9RHOB|nr:MFS transporter [Cereibacter azotoformans]AXQ93462.1 MFS transporter [Cereibacter sphaeroides]MBO4168780.1 MFS transporter [Cereibacter azotoformans]PTR13575.1 putative MFS family arabinose efflux permease [Cereibacter azotoformans]UIJ31794.1 MFS transporter [Cereibacter azotoformans]
MSSQARLAAALGVVQILAWGSSYYLMAVLATPIAADTGWPLPWVVGSLSVGLLVAGLASPLVGRTIARHGGRPVLVAGCLAISAGLMMLALAPNLAVFVAGWMLMGAGMAAGLYDPAFATLGQIYGREARRAITLLTLWGGFASTVCWPLSALMLESVGWRGTTAAYAGLHLAISVPLLLRATPKAPRLEARDHVPPAELAGDERAAFRIMAAIQTLAGLAVTIIAVHLIGLLGARGLPLAAAVALGALIGPAQVGGRLVEMAGGTRHHPVWTLLAAVSATAAGLVLLAASEWPALALILYGAGNGVYSIARGALPMALFGPERYPSVMGRLARPSLVAQAAAPLVGAGLIALVGAEGTLAVLAGIAATNLALAAVLFRRTATLRVT